MQDCASVRHKSTKLHFKNAAGRITRGLILGNERGSRRTHASNYFNPNRAVTWLWCLWVFCLSVVNSSLSCGKTIGKEEKKVRNFEISRLKQRTVWFFWYGWLNYTVWYVISTIWSKEGDQRININRGVKSNLTTIVLLAEVRHFGTGTVS